MLESLSIHAFALIEDIHIDLNKGFTVITGETGTGKSILLSALSLLLGGPGDTQSIRNGFDSASVSGTFVLETPANEIKKLLSALSIDIEDNIIIIRRVLKSNGRTLSYVNDFPIKKSSLIVISSYLVDISAQHAHQSLLKCDKQLSLVDNFSESNILLEDYQKLFHLLNKLKDERDNIIDLIASSKKEEDYLNYAFEEISKVDPKEEEDDNLTDEIHKLSQFENIHENLLGTVEMLHSSYEGGSTINNLNNSLTSLTKASHIDSILEKYQERLNSAVLECEDIYESLKDYLQDMSFSQENLDVMQQRLSQLQRLKKKYGPTLSHVIEFRDEINEKLEAINNSSDDIEFIDNKIKKCNLQLVETASLLSIKRLKGANELSVAIEKSLHSLGMPHAVFKTILIKRDDYSLFGKESVEFMLSANPGLESRPIKEIASGGELSRVMLAIKTTLREKDPVSTLVFDEVDAGIGGVIASSVANELISLSTSSQVIAITHLAAIAAKADTQLVVSKYVKSLMSYTTIVSVENEERTKEIARMLSGDSESIISLKHAESLLESE
ncbi:MAG: DNA repair protein RecN [Spirochaetaceae bacterium]|nr:DNA repair protein RecN [Spirochaetaceae bacterium]